MDPVVIIGTGLAGYTLAREFRKLDPDRPLELITADDGRSYSKPLLSTALAKGQEADDLAMARAEQMAQTLNATVRTRTPVTHIDGARRRLVAGKEERPFSSLVLAVGAHPLPLTLAGEAAERVLHVNNLADYARFRQVLTGAGRVAILGPGLIGCEFANDLVTAGYRVSLIGPDPWPLSRMLPRQAGRALQRALADAGVEWRLGTVVERVEPVESGLRLGLADGETLEAQVVLSAVGLRPNTALAEQAGLRVDRGIVVDRRLQSSRPHIYAVGDCAQVDGMVLPFVMPILHAARALARTLAGDPTEVVYPPMPVVVKTPAHPVVVAPPPRGAQGEWVLEEGDDGVHGRFLDPGGRLLGFALTGGRVADKQALTRELPPLLGR